MPSPDDEARLLFGRALAAALSTSEPDTPSDQSDQPAQPDQSDTPDGAAVPTEPPDPPAEEANEANAPPVEVPPIASGPMIDLFEIEQLRLRLPAANPSYGDGDLEIRASPRADSEELSYQAARIEKILADPRGAKRRLLVGAPPMIDRIEALKATCRGFETIIDLISRTIHLSMVSNTPMRLPPMLLLGPAGIGKTHFARSLASTLGVPAEFVAMDLLSERGKLTGLDPVWKAARAGKIAETLLAADVAAPVFVLDEVDKVSAIHVREEPLGFLHTVLERENAKAFTDEYLSFPMRADYCTWILTANDETMLAPSILSRLLVFRLPEPSPAAMRKIARNIYRAVNKEQGDWFDAEPGEKVLSVLVQHNPRRAVRIIELAMGFATQESRRRLIPSDIAAAAALIGTQEEARQGGWFKEVRGKVGFVHH